MNRRTALKALGASLGAASLPMGSQSLPGQERTSGPPGALYEVCLYQRSQAGDWEFWFRYYDTDLRMLDDPPLDPPVNFPEDDPLALLKVVRAMGCKGWLPVNTFLWDHQLSHIARIQQLTERTHPLFMENWHGRQAEPIVRQLLS